MWEHTNNTGRGAWLLLQTLIGMMYSALNTAPEVTSTTDEMPTLQRKKRETEDEELIIICMFFTRIFFQF